MKNFFETLYVNYLLWRLDYLKKYRALIQKEIGYINNVAYTHENIEYLENCLSDVSKNIDKVLKRLEKTSVW